MKKLANIVGTNLLNKDQQKAINGGKFVNCPSGCFTLYFQGPNNRCAVPGPNGTTCFGTIQNGQCCM